MEEPVRTIKGSQVVDLLNTRPTSIFGMVYRKQDGTLRTASGRLHVTNPSHGTKPGQGIRIGQSAEEALEQGNLKYYDMGKKNPDGTQGAYRTAKISRIERLTFGGLVYRVED